MDPVIAVPATVTDVRYIPCKGSSPPPESWPERDRAVELAPLILSQFGHRLGGREKQALQDLTDPSAQDNKPTFTNLVRSLCIEFGWQVKHP